MKAEIFQVWPILRGSPSSEQLRDGELSTGKLIERVGLEQANVSQHLAVLRAKQIVVSRKEGNQVFYSLRSPVLKDVLDIMRRYCQSHIAESMAALGELRRSELKRERAAAR